MRAALYARQSQDRAGDEMAITRQREDARALCDRRGWEITAEYVDNDVSGAGTKPRPGFEAMLRAVNAGQVDVVVSWSLDRLTRNARDRLRLLEAGKAKSITLALVRGSDIDLSTPAGRLTADVLGSVAAHEIEVKSDRQKRAAFQRAEMGRPPKGARLTGYTKDGELIEAEAKMVIEMFDRFSNGDSIRGVCSWLESQGYTARNGKKWSPSSVRQILVNPRYAGRAIYQGKTTGVKGNWKPLVNGAVFDAIQVKLSDPHRRTHKGTDRKYLGSGLYECDACNTKLVSFAGSRYLCRSCRMVRSGTQVDELVTSLLRARLAAPKLAQTMPQDTDDRINAIVRDIATINARKQTFADDYDAGLIDGRRFALATKKADDDIAAKEAQLVPLQARRNSVLQSKSPADEFDGASLMVQREIMDLFLTVRLRRGRRGHKQLDLDSVVILWKS